MQRVFSRWTLWLTAIGGLALATVGVAAQQGPGTLGPGVSPAVQVVSYIEVAPGTERAAAAILKQYRDAVRQEPGNQRTDALQQLDRPAHFVLLESWQNKSAFDAHASRPNTKRLSDSIKPFFVNGGGLELQLVAPVDQRPFNPFSIAMSATANDAVFVVTHVDTIPPPQGQSGAVDPGAMLKQLAEGSRKEEGNLRFDVWQGDRRNHFTVVEAWRNQRALDAHTAGGYAKEYRNQLQPLAGSPLDERVFTVVK